MLLWHTLFIQFLLISACTGVSVFFVILSQPSLYDLRIADKCFVDIKSQFNLEHDSIVLSHNFTENSWGHWSILPLVNRLSNSLIKKHHDWIMFVDPDSKVNVQRLKAFLNTYTADENRFLGYPLEDERPAIIHHFRGFDPSQPAVKYPDFGAGFAISTSLLKRLAAISDKQKFDNIFYIDVKHELAAILKDSLQIELTDASDAFCLFPKENCAIIYHPPIYSEEHGCFGEDLEIEQVYTAVKTFSEYHRTRVVAVKRTWATQLKYVDYFSDIEDQFVPTKFLGIKNTERGHCAKSLAILEYYVSNLRKFPKNKWLIIADDDTLLSVPRLLRLLRCYDHTEQVIIGERYGFGFSADGTGGYDYPTGGAGMIFSQQAAKSLVKGCSCPQDDSPDDMIIGACARSLGISIIHSPAFHQARPIDYSKDYLKRMPPISFHKFEDIDPYDTYMSLLYEEMPFDFRRHVEL